MVKRVGEFVIMVLIWGLVRPHWVKKVMIELGFCGVLRCGSFVESVRASFCVKLSEVVR